MQVPIILTLRAFIECPRPRKCAAFTRCVYTGIPESVRTLPGIFLIVFIISILIIFIISITIIFVFFNFYYYRIYWFFQFLSLSYLLVLFQFLSPPYLLFFLFLSSLCLFALYFIATVFIIFQFLSPLYLLGLYLLSLINSAVPPELLIYPT